MTDLPPCVVCNPKLDMTEHEVALCPDHAGEAPLAERYIKRDASILDEWIQEQRQEARRAAVA